MPNYGAAGTVVNGIYPGDQVTVWSAEAPVTGAASVAVNVAGVYENVVPSISVEIFFSATPGAFEVDVQDADTDTAVAYQSITNAALTTVNAVGFYARYELAPFKGRFVRLLMKTQPANAVNITARITR